ncbi:olfactory receptor class A-like protein 1 [Notamacropus eugenii]|uniref:olfactory receptor class A-like protein 1 n=1 Tax=Notamacropus eugenii TaxID=9315 RepID=UPI003B67C092
MISTELIYGVAFFFQSAIGLVGNSLLLMLYVCISFKKPQQKKPMDLIVAHLTLANMVTLFTRGIPEIMFCFGMRHFLDDVGCKALMYIYRVARGVSVCTTSLLSILQVLIISPSTSVLVSIKVRVPRYISHYFLFFWVTNAMIYIPVITSAETIKNVTVSRYLHVSHIYMVREGNESKPPHLFLFGMIFHDFIFHILMGLSSTHMVLLLYRHRKQVQHIYSSSHSPRSFPEIKATQTILLLVTCFVLFYWINNCILIYESARFEKDAKWETIGSFFGGCFPAISPLLLVVRENRIPKPYCIPGKTQRFQKDFMDVLVNS